MPDWLITSWHLFVGAAIVAVDLLATAHIVLNKRDTQSAIGWVGMVWFGPVAGPVLYYLLGINRVERKAKRLRRRHHRSRNPRSLRGMIPPPPPSRQAHSGKTPTRCSASVFRTLNFPWPPSPPRRRRTSGCSTACRSGS